MTAITDIPGSWKMKKQEEQKEKYGAVAIAHQLDFTCYSINSVSLYNFFILENQPLYISNKQSFSPGQNDDCLHFNLTIIVLSMLSFIHMLRILDSGLSELLMVCCNAKLNKDDCTFN